MPEVFSVAMTSQRKSEICTVPPSLSFFCEFFPKKSPCLHPFSSLIPWVADQSQAPDPTLMTALQPKSLLLILAVVVHLLDREVVPRRLVRMAWVWLPNDEKWRSMCHLYIPMNQILFYLSWRKGKTN